MPQKIDEQTAARLISSKQAGWYAVNAKFVEAHPQQTVVAIGDEYYLVQKSEFEVVSAGVVDVGGILKEAHNIICHDRGLGQALIDDARRVEIERKKMHNVPVVYCGPGRLAPGTLS